MNINSLNNSQRYWLGDVKNLISALSKFYGAIKLDKISQQILDINNFEKTLLDVKHALVRQITLSNNEKTIVFARTIIPKQIYNLFAQELDNLGSKPIGDSLLYKKDFNRGDFIIRKLSTKLLHDETNLISNQEIYSRSSIFSYVPSTSLKILITEYFLIMPKLKNHD